MFTIEFDCSDNLYIVYTIRNPCYLVPISTCSVILGMIMNHTNKPVYTTNLYHAILLLIVVAYCCWLT